MDPLEAHHRRRSPPLFTFVYRGRAYLKSSPRKIAPQPIIVPHCPISRRTMSARRRPLGRVALRYQRSDPGNEFTAVFYRVGERIIAADEQAGGAKIVVGD